MSDVTTAFLNAKLLSDATCADAKTPVTFQDRATLEQQLVGVPQDFLHAEFRRIAAETLKCRESPYNRGHS